MLTLIWLRGLLLHRAARLAAAAVGVAAAVALLASLGAFLTSAKSTMTQRSIDRVPVDWQIEGDPSIEPALHADRRFTDLRRVDFADTAGLEARTAGQTLTTGAGQVLGLPSGYAAAFPGELRSLVGGADGVLLAQQTAANLHAAPGDTVKVQRAGLPAAQVRVDGVVELPSADSLFQKVGAPVGAQPQAPPDNVLLLPADTWHRLFDPVAHARPDQVRTQFHARLRHALPADPAGAYARVSGSARNLEVRLAGAGRVGDNLGAALGAARADALYAQILFLFLGAPGAVLAGLLTAVITGSGATRRRTEQALLRTRGATRRTLLTLATAEAVAVGVVGAAAGLGIAALTGRLAFGSAGFGATPATTAYWEGGAVVAGLVIAVLAVLIPAARDARHGTVASARRQIGAARRAPAWLRYGLDLWLLVTAGAVFWAAGRNGYKIVLVPEGLPTISVSYWAFAAPALLWAGAGLLTWRVTYWLLGRGRPVVARLSRPLAGGLADTVAATLSRQRVLIARTVALAALTVVFAGTTSVFDATYRHQALVDAQLTNGADVTVTESPGAYVPPGEARRIAAVPGVGHVEPLQHRFAYVGADLQDLYGIRPTGFSAATELQDAYFSGGTARELIGRLARRPDAVLVSEETVKDFQLRPGDQLRLRLQDGRTRQYRTVVFHYAGIAKEFPTAPRDSFLVANADYVAAQTGSDTVGTFLVTASGRSPHELAANLRGRLGSGAQITDLDSVHHVVGTSLTAVDLRGLTTIELTYAVALAAAATGLLLALGFTERRRTFALASVLGARTRRLGAFVWTEVAVVTVGAALMGGLAAWPLSHMLVKILTGVFDPPPAGLTVPWAYLGLVVAIGLIALLAAGAAAIRAVRRPPLTVLRDL
ncbi:ABC transporter permease [Actinomadura alba]|uniref:ABC transporter permease n=1 Tax=Actinomadura alba TaxID=406431 RepID=A0ABR7LRI9_9ACTN|nr:ABC transporter permease [Actinomadura alba]MBC6467467.1 ABC transporter permease [Actinomadura alba]